MSTDRPQMQKGDPGRRLRSPSFRRDALAYSETSAMTMMYTSESAMAPIKK